MVNRYKFIEDVRECNLMIVYDKDKEEYIYISILTKPTQKVTINHRIVIFIKRYIMLNTLIKRIKTLQRK